MQQYPEHIEALIKIVLRNKQSFQEAAHHPGVPLEVRKDFSAIYNICWGDMGSNPIVIVEALREAGELRPL